MILIKKEDVYNYRYAVGKITLLRLNNNIKLIEDYSESNLMLVRNTDKNQNEEIIYISLFGNPIQSNSHTKKDKIPIYKYYQKRSYKRYKKNEDDIRELDDNFDQLYQENLEKAFINPNKFIETLNKNEISNFKTILINSKNLSESNKEISKLYKYRSCNSVKHNSYNVNDGVISFSHPKHFNDPFDCNAQFLNNLDMSAMFRVLCLMPDNNNILMWSYYANDHKGYCFEYNTKDIEYEILQFPLSGLCIVGNVEYSKKRPNLKSAVNSFSFTDIKFYIDTCFTKYEEWKHEKEYRYVLISSDYSSMNNDSYMLEESEFVPFKVPILGVYEGINSDKKEIYNANMDSIKLREVQKDDTEYRLNI